jgi:hypothetical protein
LNESLRREQQQQQQHGCVDFVFFFVPPARITGAEFPAAEVGAYPQRDIALRNTFLKNS